VSVQVLTNFDMLIVHWLLKTSETADS